MQYIQLPIQSPSIFTKHVTVLLFPYLAIRLNGKATGLSLEDQQFKSQHSLYSDPRLCGLSLSFQTRCLLRANFLFVLLLCHEDGGYMFLRSVRLLREKYFPERHISRILLDM
jgi:hypothetical protein